MRKKLFAILMSATMVASFMPSMAFATASMDTHPTKADSVDRNHRFILDTAASSTNGVKNSDVETLKAGNNKDLVVEYTPATCTEDGSVTIKCNKDTNELCKATKTYVIKKGHNFEKEENGTLKKSELSLEDYVNLMKEAKADGFLNDAQAAGQLATLSKTKCYVEAPICTECGAIDKTIANIAEKDHDTTVLGTETKQTPSCDGTVTCNKCNKKVAATNANSVGTKGKHSFEENDGSIKTGVTPTSTMNICGGATENIYTCTTCGEKKSVVTGTPTCRIFKNAVKTDKVTKDGSDKYYLEGTSTEVSEAKGYKQSDANPNVWYKSDTTVTENGAKYYGYTCNDCGHVVKGEQITASDATHKHAWKKVTSEPTCTKDGYEAVFCEGCGKYAPVSAINNKDYTGAETKIETVGTVVKPALGHTFDVKKVEATCAIPGHYEISCSVCGKEYTGTKYVQFKADSKKEPLYLHKDGAVTATGAYGDYRLDYIDPAVKNHKFTKKVVVQEPTCTVDELSGYKCDVCGKFDVHNVTKKPGTALGHKAEKVNVKDATCGTAEKYNVKCATCGKYAVTEKYNVKKAADWSADSEKAHDFTGKLAVVGKNAKCDFSKWVVVKDSTVFEEGVKQLKCSKCGAMDATKTVIAKKTVGKPVVKLTSTKGRMTVKASAKYATGYKVTYKRYGKAATTKTYTAESISRTYRLLKGKKYTVTVTAFASNGTDTVEGAAVTKTITIKK